MSTCSWRGVLTAGVVSVAAVATACSPQTVVNAAAPAASAPARGITVNGVGKASGKPTVARSTIGVEVRAASAEQAIGEVNTRMSQVIAAVEQAGVDAKDVRTSTLSLNFERNYPEPPRPPQATEGGKAAEPPAQLPSGFYTATNNVEVTMRDLSAAGKVLSAATSAGANQIYGIRFEIEDLAPLQEVARQQAVESAHKRAQRLAQLAGVKLGPAVSIVELDDGSSGPVPMIAMAKMAPAPVESGELTISTSVQIVYALQE